MNGPLNRGLLRKVRSLVKKDGSHIRQDPLFENLFISAGAMKAGTTWLFMILERHPELYFTFEKEIGYFYHRHHDSGTLSDPHRLAAAHKKYLRFDPQQAQVEMVRNRLHWTSNYLDGPVDDTWYKNLFALQKHQKYSCDFSNLYALLSEEAWRHVASCAENLKVLYTMRHPAERVWSHLKFHLKYIGKIDEIDGWGRSAYVDFLGKPYIRDNSEYASAIRRMRNVLSEEDLKISFFEDRNADQRGFLADLEDFLDVPHFKYPQALLDKRINQSVSKPMPEFLPSLLQADVARITNELIDLGLDVPASWQESI